MTRPLCGTAGPQCCPAADAPRPRTASSDPVSVVPSTVSAMRRGYVEAHVSLRESFQAAVRWLGERPTLIAPSTSAVEASGWLESVGIPIGTTSNRHSRFGARPQGAVIAWCLNLDEILDIESRQEVDYLVVVRAHASHAPWITAHAAEY